MDCSPPASSIHEILQARILEWVAIFFSLGSSQSRDENWVSWIVGRFFIHWAMRDPHFVRTQYLNWKSKGFNNKLRQAKKKKNKKTWVLGSEVSSQQKKESTKWNGNLWNRKKSLQTTHPTCNFLNMQDKMLWQKATQLKNEQRNWIDSFSKKTYNWPTRTWKMLNINNSQGNADLNHNEMLLHTC